ncbi:phosphoanhydride phosphohydrolase [Dyella lipolytica]|uniref:Histidine-type phosphatase n=1 Tax=Dyella lipolytica TaxID=1867835 RepID=A0ABW8IQE5_9GAMM|nr:histidine-type phosphatase [Dyella lipolytica]GLQ45127.1 phosphoanhydride phosphohydrolase [Dyella lipolytica]
MNPSARVQSRAIGFLLCVLLGLSGTAKAVDTQNAGDLQLVIVLSRHGVRSPTAKPGSLDVFSSKPWPAWPVPAGYLTPHGKQLMAMMGSWYRAYYANAGLLPLDGCVASPSLYVVADDEERTLESAHGLMDGFDPNCAIEVHPSPKNGPDALFSHDFTHASDADRAEAMAAVLGRIGGDPKRLALANAGLLDQMQTVLLGCQSGTCTPAQTAGKKILLDQDSSIAPAHGDGLLSIKSPLHNASTFAENFFLEYAEGMPMSDVAWGRISSLQLGQLLTLHATYSDIGLRTPIIARSYAGHLATRILATLQQRADVKPTAEAIGSNKAKIVFLVGHDTNIETLAGLLDLHWMLAEQPADPTSTGGALVFELRREKGTDHYNVRAYYVSQSMEQMRESSMLDLKHPPELAPIFIPGCSPATPGYGCPLNRFAGLVKQANQSSAHQ